MSGAGRILMDVSYTRTQRVSVGITRTVRRLEEELRRLSDTDGPKFATVSFHSSGFRELGADALSSSDRRAFRKSERGASWLFRWITGAFFRKVVLMALFLPWALLRFIWSITSQRTFNFLSRSEVAVAFAPGDILVLCDASWNYPVWVAARQARAKGAKVVLMVYDLIPLRHPDFCFRLVPHIFRLWLEEMVRCSDALICISKATADDLLAFARERDWQLPPVRHFRLGSDPAPGSAGGQPRAELLQFGAAAGTFAAIGSFEPKKNYDFLLEVFENLWSREVSAKLLIIGRATPECEDLVSKLRRHPQQGRYLLTLFDATDAEVAYAYANSRALLFPSLAEGFGLPLVEARARGCRVIASDLPAFLELADDGVSFYPRHSAASLEALILQDLNSKHQDVGDVGVMPAFTWQDSARQLRGIICEHATTFGRGSDGRNLL
jgi:glycosyltransferase involved in cell wall biosynthesis